MGDLSSNFSRAEFACKCGCGLDTVDVELLAIVETIRQHYDASVKVTSGCRCPARNEQEGGSEKSQHLVCRAADIQVEGVEAVEVFEYLDNLFPNTHGLGKYRIFTHVDSRSQKARWSLV